MAGEPKTTRNRMAPRAAVAVLAVLGAIWFFGRWDPPQIGSDQEAVRSVNALFTAVTARDDKLLGECEHRLHALKDAGKLPDKSSAFLNGVIIEARDHGWESAAQALYDFIKGQHK